MKKFEIGLTLIISLYIIILIIHSKASCSSCGLSKQVVVKEHMLDFIVNGNVL